MCPATANTYSTPGYYRKVMKTSAGLVNKVDLSGRGYALFFSSFFIACQKELYDKCNLIATACGKGGGGQPPALKT